MQIQASPATNANAGIAEIPSFAKIMKANSRGKSVKNPTTTSINVGGAGCMYGPGCFLVPSDSFAIPNRSAKPNITQKIPPLFPNASIVPPPIKATIPPEARIAMTKSSLF